MLRAGEQSAMGNDLRFFWGGGGTLPSRVGTLPRGIADHRKRETCVHRVPIAIAQLCCQTAVLKTLTSIDFRYLCTIMRCSERGRAY